MNADTNYRSGWVPLVGPPNVGKSTLMNAFLGQKVAIVTSRPQTTRNQISGIYTDYARQVIFIDTPGVHEQRGRMNRFLLQSAWNALSGADAALALFDGAAAAKKPHSLDKQLDLIVPPLMACGAPVLAVLNKSDAVKDKAELLPAMERLAKALPNAEVYPVSALKEEGLDGLMAGIHSRLPAMEPMYPEDQISTVPLRFMASEIVREKCFLNLRQELPYSTAVEVETWEELPDKQLVRIGAVIYVGRKSHKSMVIGKQGQNLKKIGAEAREDLQELLDSRVYLELWVKVKENWTEDPGFLRQLGMEG